MDSPLVFLNSLVAFLFVTTCAVFNCAARKPPPPNPSRCASEWSTSITPPDCDDNPTVDVTFDEKKNHFVPMNKDFPKAKPLEAKPRKSPRREQAYKASQPHADDERIFKTSVKADPQRKAVPGRDLFESKLFEKDAGKSMLAAQKGDRAQVGRDIFAGKAVPNYGNSSVQPGEAENADSGRTKKPRPLVSPRSVRSQTGTEMSSVMSTNTKSGGNVFVQ